MSTARITSHAVGVNSSKSGQVRRQEGY